MNQSLKDFIQEKMDTNSISAERLASLADVPLKFIVAFLGDKFEELPAAPYTKNYLRKIAKALRIDEQEMTQAFAEFDAAELKKSGRSDLLPAHRFKLEKKTYLWILLPVALLIIGALVYKLMMRSGLQIYFPKESRSIVNTSTMVISGKTNPLDKVLVNGLPVIVNAKGVFETNFQLESGLNVIEVESKNLFGGGQKQTREIIFAPSGENTQ